MAHCVISAVMDTDAPGMPTRPACVVHTTWAPCDRNGEPAVTTPLHCADGDPDRESAIEHWRRKTHGQRPTWLHHGSLGDDRDHDINDAGACWCLPERFGGAA
jgi:hypothetical protein